VAPAVRRWPSDGRRDKWTRLDPYPKSGKIGKSC
jgi:hypothetical protein